MSRKFPPLDRAGLAVNRDSKVRCRDAETEVISSKFEAEGFNRKLGATLHAVFAGEFLPRR